MQMIAVKAGILSPDSVSHTFDSSANGYGRAEGVNAIYIKRLSDAMRDQDPIRAVIRGTSVNSNGRTLGITQPSSSGQEAVIRKAYYRAGLPTNETDYVETHGTGTKIGDPIELESISRALQHRSGRPVLVGGVKPSLGHSEGSSGLSSIIKVVLALEHGEIPATIGVSTVNPDAKCGERNISIVTQSIPWPASAKPRASVNSFGFGGANSHAVLEASPQPPPSKLPIFKGEKEANRLTLLPFSARSERSLYRLISNFNAYVAEKSDQLSIRDLALTLMHHRSKLQTRGFIITSQKSVIEGLEPDKLRTLGDLWPVRLPVSFVYTGQGGQWPRMGSQLLISSPTFFRTIQMLDQFLWSLGDLSPSWSIEAILRGQTRSEEDIHLAERSQTVCTAVQVALTRVLHEWNIVASSTIGHSSGEIGAAFAAGFLSMKQAITVAYLRGIAVSKGATNGAMISVGLSEKSAREMINKNGVIDAVVVACVNSAQSTTISGDAASIKDLQKDLAERHIFARLLRTNGKAYHSHHMKLVGSEYEQLLNSVWDGIRHIASEEPQYQGRMFSTVTGVEILGSEPSTPAYWRQNLESTVQFERGLLALLKTERCHLVEVGPHPVMELPAKETATVLFSQNEPVPYSPTLFRNRDAELSMLELAGMLYLHGHDLVNTLPASSHLDEKDDSIDDLDYWTPLKDLPTYPWDYEEVNWSESRAVAEYRFRRYPRHELLGAQVPGSNPAVVTWRNVLDVSEVTFLKDHCLGPSIVFPAAAYLSMVIEAICQVHEKTADDCPGAEMRSIDFLKALGLSNGKDKVELFTELRPAKLSNVTASARWWDFHIGSVSEDGYSAHASGQIRLALTPMCLHRKLNLSLSNMEEQAIGTWYDKFKKEGLNWGPRFAAMKRVFCDPRRNRYECVASTKLLQVSDEELGSTRYIAHPINIDGLLQAAFVATTLGSVKNLRAKVPVSMGSLHISGPQELRFRPSNTWSTDAISEKVGFGTVKVAAEMYNQHGQALISMEDVRCIAYQGNAQSDQSQQHSPLVRVAWKPDISFCAYGANHQLSPYLDWFEASCHSDNRGARELTRTAGLLDLVVHNNPRQHIFIIEAENESTPSILEDVLQKDSPFRRCETYRRTNLAKIVQNLDDGKHSDYSNLVSNTNGSTVNTSAKDESVDVAVLTPAVIREFGVSSLVQTLFDRFGKQITIVWCGPFDQLATLEDMSRVIHEPEQACPMTAMISGHTKATVATCQRQKHNVLLIHGEQLEPAMTEFVSRIEDHCGFAVQGLPLSQVSENTVKLRCIVICALEINTPFLVDLTEGQMKFLQILTDRASMILWLTNGGFLDGQNPDFAPSLGLSRTIMLEQPSVQFSIFDVDSFAPNVGVTAENVSKVLLALLNESEPDFEFAQRNGVVHTLRWEPEDLLNLKLQSKAAAKAIHTPLMSAGRVKLAIEQPGQMDTLHFSRDDFEMELPPEYVEIDVKAVGMNAKDVYALSARIDTKDASCSCECAGIVTQVGSRVNGLVAGDKVVAMAPGHFASKERLPEWSCLKLLEDEDFCTMSTVPIVFSTALHALKNCSKLQKGESVLIHSGAGGVGIAAIQIAQLLGAEIFTTVGNEAKRKFLTNTFGIPTDHIFSSHDSAFLADVMSATDGCGVDVVLNSLVGDLLHDSFSACAEFGRFVEIGKRDILDHGTLDMGNFERGVSFTAFDLSSFFHSRKKSNHDLWQRLLVESVELVRCKAVVPVKPLERFDVSEVVQAFRHFSLRSRMGKIAVSFESLESEIKVTPQNFDTVLHCDKSYIMVGCLGGLGRSLSKWMASRGARNFVFLGRSALDKPAAKSLVHDLQSLGCHVDIVRGDVCRFEDVKSTINEAKKPIGGVVQAAMGLSEALWSTMSSKSWHISVDPKLKGTWHLHNALMGNDTNLDFFVMTSSIAGTVGTATESNYCAGNAFLDAFARYRKRLGLPGTSIGLGMISEVGYLHEHPDIEKLMRRKGIQSINEDELLQIFDAALQNPHSVSNMQQTHHYDRLVTTHLLTGIDFTGLKQQRERGFEGDNHVLADPRASLFAAAFARTNAGARGAADGLTRQLPDEVLQALQDGNAGSLLGGVRAAVARKISNLILLPLEKLQHEQHLSDFGLDSMLAAEFRTYVFHSLGVDVPFMMMLGNTTTVNGLAQFITQAMEEKNDARAA